MLARFKAHHLFSPRTVLEEEKQEKEAKRIKEILLLTSLPEPNLFLFSRFFTLGYFKDNWR